MRILMYLITTFCACNLLGLSAVWAGFTVTMLLVTKINSSSLWEIPMGVLACSIITDIFADEATGILWVLIPLAMVLITYSKPKKLPLVFAVSVLALFLKNIYAVAAMWSLVWCGVRVLFVNPQKYSTIKRQALQGNNSR